MPDEDRVSPSEYTGPITAIDPGSNITVPPGQSYEAVPASRDRLKFWLENRSSVEMGVRLGVTGAASGSVAFYLGPGDLWEEYDFKGAVFLFHASGSSQVLSRGIV